tara:strand:+ start:4539 stop:5843 length:1305 start_codon:yes stop_codon:yes gene_type:complete
MAANQALIQASRGTNEQFIDYGAVLQPVVKGMMRDLEIADNKMASFINSLPPGANIEKLPEGMRPEVEKYLRDSKNEYAEAAKIASKLSPSDAGYREAVDKMNSIKTGFVNLNKNLEAHLANRVEFIQDKDDLSGSLSGNDNIFLTSVYAGDYEGLKVTGGELEFLDKSTNKYKRNSEFPQYSLTDVVGADGVAKIFDTERNLGNKGLGWDPKRSGREVNRLFKKVGNQGVVDMAFDGFDEYDGNYVDTVVKQQLAPKMSMQDWMISSERDSLTTKEGFAPYKAGFQNFISDIVKDGYNEGKTVYDKRINLDGDKTKSFKAVNSAINKLLSVDKLKLSDLLSLTLPSDRKFAERDGNFVILDSSGYDIPGTEFSPDDKKSMRNALQFAVNLPVQFRSNSEITSTSGFDFNAGLSSDTTSTTKDVPIPIYNTPKI